MINMLPGEKIYKESALIIDSMLKTDSRFNDSYSEEEKSVVKRVIHATSDIGYAGSMFFRGNAVQNAVQLIKARSLEKTPLKIVCDSEMTKAGISRNVNKNISLELYCYIGLSYEELREKFRNALKKYDFLSELGADDDSLTKSAFSIKSAILENLPDFIAIGNAPTALVEAMNLCKYLFKTIGYKPETVIGMPVGFVGAADSKKILYEDNFYSSIGNFGNMGGSSSAASAVNALLSLS